MRSIVAAKLEEGRIRRGRYGSDESYGLTGAFVIQGPRGAELRIMSSSGDGWEHVSVSISWRCPNWEEMAYVKSLFWDEEECVMQLHPPRSQYVNCHPYCLHLWRPLAEAIPMPDPIMVGPRLEG
ncbi:hypothetical protein I6F36_38325 [Bradyrhizobium sp. BRP19]|uniref:DUF7694 domain-containing protein n=1 Tax=Bradyrhizobium sp. BRP19 TaxID=2793823 RepID=UPI001CD698D8|nr:hypothetical protein [Bradyrhizobium sp. BRP19]MCA1552582.1 hypothetical protein [Bradyrhizobium sp. BRP19]